MFRVHWDERRRVSHICSQPYLAFTLGQVDCLGENFITFELCSKLLHVLFRWVYLSTGSRAFEIFISGASELNEKTKRKISEELHSTVGNKNPKAEWNITMRSPKRQLRRIFEAVNYKVWMLIPILCLMTLWIYFRKFQSSWTLVLLSFFPDELWLIPLRVELLATKLWFEKWTFMSKQQLWLLLARKTKKTNPIHFFAVMISFKRNNFDNHCRNRCSER